MNTEAVESKYWKRNTVLRHRSKALETLTRMLAESHKRKHLSSETLISCAERIKAADGDSGIVHAIRMAAAEGDLDWKFRMIRAAVEACREISDQRRRENGRICGAKGKRGSAPSHDNTPEAILERLAMLAATGTAVLVRNGSGAVEVRLAASRVGKGSEILGYYDIRADARDMLADIKEAMA